MTTPILDFTERNGLVFCNQVDGAKNHAEALYLHEAKQLGADAVFFRRFFSEDKSRPYYSEPSVCIFERKDSFFQSESHLELHASLWSAGRNEVYIIKSKNRLDILNARKPASVKADGTLGIEILLSQSSDSIKEYNDDRFSAFLFGTGTFWEQSEFRDALDPSMSPYRYLLSYLMTARTFLFSSKNLNLSATTIDKLLVVCILVKFLEEIKDDDGKHTLRGIYNAHQVKDFAEVLEKGLCVVILGELAKELNGRIFDSFELVEKKQLQNTDLGLLASFLRADVNINSGQLFLWKQYSFKHLPAEVISAIYENFIQAEAERRGGKEKGVVYTPIHLVNFLVDEVMPLEDAHKFSNESFRILDPSCGSGVFLVAAYKRLLQWWAINNSKKDKIQYPDSQIAQRLLEDNIFGVDSNKTATLVSIFGLTTALLDKLTPKQIWNDFKFNDLGEKNINYSDFFLWAGRNDNKLMFDLVLGNPPFNVEQGKNKKEILRPELLKKLDFKHKKIPRNNFALHFFEGSMTLAKKVCMIIPSNVLLYDRSSQKYRIDVFSDFTVSKIVDFTHLRRILFESADTPVVALIAESKVSNYKAIEHTVVSREHSSEYKTGFLIDHYNRHTVPWNWAVDETKQFVWKTNLLGGGRLFHLINRLSLLEDLNTFLQKKSKVNNWEYSIGYIVKHSKKNPVRADFISQKYVVKPKSFKENGTFEKVKEPSTFFVETRTKALYEPPHIIFQLVIRNEKIPMAFVDEYLGFNSSFVGIAAPKEDRQELYEIYKRLHLDENVSNLYRTFILATSSKALIYHETSIVKKDIDNLPYPKESKYLTVSNEEEIIINDVLSFYRHSGKSIFKVGKILEQTASKIVLEAFGTVFCGILNNIYEEKRRNEHAVKWQTRNVYQTKSFTICQFSFGTNAADHFSFKYVKKENIEFNLNEIIFNSVENQAVIYSRVSRIYDHIDGHDTIFLIKPNATRYWLQSIALRDADDTFIDFKKAGY